MTVVIYCGPNYWVNVACDFSLVLYLTVSYCMNTALSAFVYNFLVMAANLQAHILLSMQYHLKLLFVFSCTLVLFLHYPILSVLLAITIP